MKCIAILGAKRRACKVSSSVNITNSTVVYDEPPKSLDLPHLLPNATLEFVNVFRHPYTIVFITLGDGDDVFLELDILSALLGKGFS